jgi:hypothetical protein
VISCALALLAAQPSAAAQRGPNETGPSMKIAGEIKLHSSDYTPASRESQPSSPRRDVQRSGFADSARNLHVLATVEILQRLLAFELRPIERQMVPALIFAPLSVATVDLLLSPPCRIHAANCLISFLSREQRFAIERYLLAPPVA